MVRGEPEAEGARVIGGTFALVEPGEHEPAWPAQWPSGRCLAFANARCAMRLVALRLAPRRVWLPSYLCESALAPFEDQAELRFYGVDETLEPEDDRWVDSLTDRDLVVVIHYFGFPVDRSITQRIKESGATLLSDAAQAMLSRGIGRDADLVVLSPRKQLGVPDGGVLIDRTGRIRIDPDELEAPDPTWHELALRAARMRGAHDRGQPTGDWYAAFREAEARQPLEPTRMSDRSRELLRSGLDLDAIAARRRSNYACLAERLHEHGLRPDLPAGVVPLGFPVVVDHRDAVRELLFRSRVYPPVHWPVPEAVPSSFRASRQLAGRIMTLPCDQRYDEQDMERLARLLVLAIHSRGGD